MEAAVKTLARSIGLCAAIFSVTQASAQAPTRTWYTGVRCPNMDDMKRFIGLLQEGESSDHALTRVTSCSTGLIEFKVLDGDRIESIPGIGGTYRIYEVDMTKTSKPVDSQQFATTDVRPAEPVTIFKFDKRDEA
jgi:hypothetical protein